MCAGGFMGRGTCTLARGLKWDAGISIRSEPLDEEVPGRGPLLDGTLLKGFVYAELAPT